MSYIISPRAHALPAHRFSGAIILKIAYGYNVDREGDDSLVGLAEETLVSIFHPAMIPGQWIVDSFPNRKSDYSFLVL